MRATFLPIALLSCVAAACGPALDGADGYAGSDGALTATFAYHCSGPGAPHGLVDVWVALGGDSAQLSQAASFATTSAGSFDPAYKPRTRANMTRFLGFSDWNADLNTALYVDNALRAGAASGKIQLEWSGETYGYFAYACTAAPLPVFVTAARTPDLFAKQWSGTRTSQGYTQSLTLGRGGTYLATIAGAADKGYYKATDARVYPFTFQLTSSVNGQNWTAQVAGPDGTLTVTRGVDVDTLAGAPESAAACAATKGTWSATPAATGLRCACPKGKALVWAAGGCVN